VLPAASIGSIARITNDTNQRMFGSFDGAKRRERR
jgi:hypothetical protein